MGRRSEYDTGRSGEFVVYVIPELRLVYLAQPRVASNSVRHWLEALGLHVQIANGHHGIHTGKLTYYLENEWTVFTVVRNHWDCLVSWWYQDWNRRRSAETFGSWLRPWCAQTSWVARKSAQEYELFRPFTVHANTIIKFEGLEANLRNMILTLPRYDDSEQVDRWVQGEDTLPKLLHHNPSTVPKGTHTLPLRTAYRDYYTPNLMLWVTDQFVEEIMQHDYTFQ